MLDVGRHPNIELLAYSEVESLAGEAGNFTATIRRKARFVEESKCTGCGACTEKCPVLVADDFNVGLSSRHAVYSYFAQGIPSTHTIDAQYCRQKNDKKCGICVKMCQAEAINFDQEDRVIEINIGAVIIASGYEVFNPNKIPEYGYKKIPNVITALEFERLLSASGPTHGHLSRPSDLSFKTEYEELKKSIDKAKKTLERLEEKHGLKSEDVSTTPSDDEERKEWVEKFKAFQKNTASLVTMEAKVKETKVAERLAFVQCVGSRDFRFYPFCSSYCCMHAIKEAIIAHEHGANTTSTVFGMDIRAVGKGFEEYKIRGGNNSNITYVRGRVAEINEADNHNPVIVYEDTRERVVKSEEFDMVVLSTACAPSEGIESLAKILGVELNEFGFFQTDPVQPLDTTRDGVYVCGCAHSPMDIPESVAQASSAAARAVELVLSKSA